MGAPLPLAVVLGATGRLVDADVFTRCAGDSLATSFRADKVAGMDNSCGLFAGTVDGSVVRRDVMAVDDGPFGCAADTDTIKGGWDASLA